MCRITLDVMEKTMGEKIFKNTKCPVDNIINYSFVIDTYNQEDIILGCLKSVLCAVDKFNKGYCTELIIADDGSSDNNVFVILTWIEKYKDYFACIKFLTNEKNLGLTKNTANAFRHVEGKSVFLCDGDDMLCGNDVFSVMDECREDEIILCPVIRFENDSVIDNKNQYYSYVKYALYDRNYIIKKAYFSSPIVHGGVVGKKMICDERVLEFSERVVMLDDRARFVKIFELYPDIKIQYKNHPLIFYRTSSNQVSNRNGSVFKQIVDDWKYLDRYLISRDNLRGRIKKKILIEAIRLENPDNLRLFEKFDFITCMEILKRRLDALINEFFDALKYQNVLNEYLQKDDN